MSISTPFVRIEKAIEILLGVYRDGLLEIQLERLSKKLSKSISVLRDGASTATILGFSFVEKGTLHLTDRGQEFCKAITSENQNRVEEILQESIKSDDVLRYVGEVIKLNHEMQIDEIGRAVSAKFSKNWKNRKTMEKVGRACASILSYAGLVHYEGLVVSDKPLTQRKYASVYNPDVGYDMILKILEELSRFDRVKPENLFDGDTKYKKISEYLAILESLGLVERDHVGTYKLSNAGESLSDPTVSDSERRMVFQRCLLNSPYREGIIRLTRLSDGFDNEKAGRVIEHWMKRKWNAYSSTTYGRKFLNWLKHANLLEERGQDLYIVLPLEEYTHDQFQRKQVESISTKLRTLNIDRIFTIGRLIGNLEAIGWLDQDGGFDVSTSALKTHLHDFSDLQLLLDSLMITHNIATDDSMMSVYNEQVNFMSDKIRERILEEGEQVEEESKP